METLAIVSVFLALYFLPAMVATLRGKSNSGAIWLLNLLIGWTAIGWIVALAMACQERGA